MAKNPPFIIKDRNTSIIEDTYLLAALLTFDPSIRYYPLLNEAGRVSFEVHGRIADQMRRLYEGEAAPVNEYISNLKSLRSAIFALKNTFECGRSTVSSSPEVVVIRRSARVG